MSNRQPRTATLQPSTMRRSPSIARSPVRRTRRQRSIPRWRLFVCVLLPFGAAYYVSYVFWLISPLIAGSLTSELNLSSSDLGWFASSYVFALMVAQLPIGGLIDRHGSRQVQSACLIFAAAGAIVFALGDTLAVLILGRIMIGLGVATILIAGLKSIASWFPADQIATANGLLVSLGALGAITATEPAAVLIDAFGWRLVHLGLAGAAVFCAVVIFAMVPEPKRLPLSRESSTTLRAIYSDRQFWKIAPLSAACVGTAWAMQGFLAAPWFSDVEAFDRQTVIRHLFVMAVALGVGATLLGTLSDRLRKVGIATGSLFGCIALISIVSELSILQHWPIPSYLCWAMVALMGASGVLSHTIIASYFPKEASGRANTALHLLHLGAAFVVQWATGAIIDLWQIRNAVHPVQAYQMAFAVNFVMQAAGLIWFLWPDTGRLTVQVSPAPPPALQWQAFRPLSSVSPYCVARREWALQLAAARAHRDSWWFAALGSSSLFGVLMGLLVHGG